MNLNLEGKIKLRKNVEELLKTAPNNKKIQLPKETIEQLLFDEITYYDSKQQKNIKLKLPTWSGDFLKKLDLSQVKFDDVSWTLIKSYELNGSIALKNANCDPKNIKKFEEIMEKNGFIYNGDNVKKHSINYSGTNAKIDFTKSWDYKNYDKISIKGCDFSNCQFSFPKTINPYFELSNFENTDLSNVEFNDLFITHFIFRGAKDHVNLKNTGAKLTLSMKDVKDYTEGEFFITKKEYQEIIQHYLSNNWMGCYLNGNLVRETKQDKYVNEILDLITEQIEQSGPKR